MADSSSRNRRGSRTARRALVLGAGLALALSVAAPAMAQELCAGTTGTVYVCTDPTGRTLISDCVYLGDPTCQQVTVPGPTLTCGGARFPDSISCG